MTVTPTANPQNPQSKHRAPLRWTAAVLAILAGATLLFMVWLIWFYYPATLPPAQPIAFSHRIHAGDKRISCVVCHDEAETSARAGVPPLQTCMLCHQQIIIDHPQVAKLREHYFSRTPVEWVRVYQMPEFVYFNHQVHVNAGVDCGRCHGDVRQMDRVQAQQEFQMGFCLDCHRQRGVTTDCYTCHR